MKLIVMTISILVLASSASASDWARDFNVWISPSSSTGITISGLGQWITLSVDKQGNANISNQISTRPIQQTPIQKKRKRTFSIGIRN